MNHTRRVPLRVSANYAEEQHTHGTDSGGLARAHTRVCRTRERALVSLVPNVPLARATLINRSIWQQHPVQFSVPGCRCRRARARRSPSFPRNPSGVADVGYSPNAYLPTDESRQRDPFSFWRHRLNPELYPRATYTTRLSPKCKRTIELREGTKRMILFKYGKVYLITSQIQ